MIFGVASLNSINAETVKTRVYLFNPNTATNVSSAPPNTNFTVYLNIANVTELIGWQVFISWNASLLDLVQAAEGPFLNKGGAFQSDFLVRKPGDQAWPYADTLYLADSLIAPSKQSSASGSGTLATMTFRVKTIGVSIIHFIQEPGGRESKFKAFDPFSPPSIPHVTEDGYFAYPAPKVSVIPTEVVGLNWTAGTIFDVNIKVTNVEKLHNWTLTLKWVPSLLDAISVTEGTLLKSGGTTQFPSPKIDQAGGTLQMNQTLSDPLAEVSGNGTLATVTFLVQEKGFGSLDLVDAKLFSSEAFIPHLLQGGYFSNVMRDVAIRSVDASPTSVSPGELVNILVEVENKGEYNETFSVTVSFDSSAIGSSEVRDLTPGEVKTLPTFVWDTTDVDADSYNITARASHILGEVDVANNVGYAPSKVTVGGGGSALPTTLIIGGVAAVAVIGIVAFFLYRRSRS